VQLNIDLTVHKLTLEVICSPVKVTWVSKITHQGHTSRWPCVSWSSGGIKTRFEIYQLAMISHLSIYQSR